MWFSQNEKVHVSKKTCEWDAKKINVEENLPKNQENQAENHGKSR